MDMDKKIDIESTQDGDYSVKGTRKFSIFAYICCVLSAIIIWLLIMNVERGNVVPSPVETESTQTVVALNEVDL